MVDSKYAFKVIEKQSHSRGKIYCIRIHGSAIEVLFTYHALERINQWGLFAESVLESLLYPEEVIVGHRGRYIAHKRYDKHLIRAVYEYDETLPVLITVYYPRHARYFEGGEKYADKIFKGR